MKMKHIKKNIVEHCNVTHLNEDNSMVAMTTCLFYVRFYGTEACIIYTYLHIHLVYRRHPVYYVTVQIIGYLIHFTINYLFTNIPYRCMMATHILQLIYTTYPFLK